MEEKIANLQEQILKMSKQQEEQSAVLKKLVSFISDQDDEVKSQSSEHDADKMLDDTNDSDSDSVSPHSLISQQDVVEEGGAVTTSVWSQRLTKYNTDEITAPAISSDLAEFVSKALTNKPDHKELEDLHSKYKRPTNIPYLTVPKVNIECWRLMPQSSQNLDKQLQRDQGKIVKAMLPMVAALDELNKNKPSLDTLREKITDSFELMANCQMDLNFNRREAIRPHLHKAAHIANRDTPVTEFLFGNEVEAEMKKVDVSSKLHQNMKATDRPNFKRIQNFRAKAKAFLGVQGGQRRQAFASPNSRRPSTSQQMPAPHQTSRPQQPARHFQKTKKGNPNLWKNKRKF